MSNIGLEIIALSSCFTAAGGFGMKAFWDAESGDKKQLKASVALGLTMAGMGTLGTLNLPTDIKEKTETSYNSGISIGNYEGEKGLISAFKKDGKFYCPAGKPDLNGPTCGLRSELK